MSCYTDAILLTKPGYVITAIIETIDPEEGEEDNDADVNISYVHPYPDRWHPAGAAELSICMHGVFQTHFSICKCCYHLNPQTLEFLPSSLPLSFSCVMKPVFCLGYEK